ncbi:MAG: hypothetical protein MRERV_75c002 [Mycoplasmataceae bacterium RV_VA103A]|nr:MAG: hypothetical protein MRERV_75c002 [Mycoplasmataceae bacterium RV_VA103A]
MDNSVKKQNNYRGKNFDNNRYCWIKSKQIIK